jgi:hypothetical protein
MSCINNNKLMVLFAGTFVSLKNSISNKKLHSKLYNLYYVSTHNYLMKLMKIQKIVYNKILKINSSIVI